MSQANVPLSGAREARPNFFRRIVARAQAQELAAFVVPGPEVARAAGVDLEAAGLGISATPRHAGVLVLVGGLPRGLKKAAAVAYAQMPRPRAILAVGAGHVSPLPEPNVSVGTGQEDVAAGVAELRRIFARSAFSTEAADFDLDAVRTQTEYVCPMHPQVVRSEPDSCPICGMDLVPREAAGGNGHGTHHEGMDHGGHDGGAGASHGEHEGHDEHAGMERGEQDEGHEQMDQGSDDEGEGQRGHEGMDHGEMSGMEGMDSGSMDSGEMARQMVMPNGEYSDAAFVDAMVPHHEGAVEMAQVALENAEHEEIRTLAQDIISGQQAEIEMFVRIREGLEGSPMEGMSEEEMNQMMGMMDAQDLAGQRPFDRAFLDAMIPHHESAMAMAKVALEESENGEIRGIAEDIVGAQKREIAQMRSWRQQWYPEG